MKDRFGREIDYLRISVTDRCNLRCRYCMPQEGVSSVGHENILRFDEILQLVKIFCAKGIKNVKITGGEPLVRRNVIQLVREIKQLGGIEKLSMTTNAVLLCEYLEELQAAGLDTVNISLDTMNPERYRSLTGGGELAAVLEAIEACSAYTELKLKLNCVLLADTSQEDILDIAAMAREHSLDVRFIEAMPIGLGKGMQGMKQDEAMAELESIYGAAMPCGEKRGQGPAVYYSFPGFLGKIGFISPMSHKFCASCNRIRLTADGFLKPCLQYAEGRDLKAAIRSGMSTEALTALIEESIYSKPQGHCFAEANTARCEICEDQRLMSGIGG